MHLGQKLKGMVIGRYNVLSGIWNHPLNRGSRIRALRDYFVWNAVRFSMDARHVVKLPHGIEVILGRKENYGSAVYTHLLSDPAELLFLAHALRSEDLFADVGANVGMYSVWVAGITKAKVVSLEPVPETFRALGQNIRLNNLAELITAKQIAVGEAPGEVWMTSDEGGLDHVVENTDSSQDLVRIEIARIDDALPRCPFAMKIDVEGYEYKALKGAEGVLSDPTLRAIVIELQDWTLQKFGSSEQDCRDFLASFGFEAVRYDPATRELVSLPSKGLNAIFVRLDEDLRQRLRTAPRVLLPGSTEGH